MKPPAKKSPSDPVLARRSPRHIRFATAASAAALLALTGCAAFRSPTVPMPATLVRATCPAEGGAAKTLIVFLPGAFSATQEFIDEGYTEAVKSRRIAADMMIADAHLGYYRNKSVVDRLEEDVFTPARRAGYDKVWVVGISLGGFGTLLHAQMAPHASTAGLVAISPYLGEKAVIAAVDAAGGLERWQAPPAPATPEAGDFSVELWRWLQGYSKAKPAKDRPPLYLAWASEDDRGPALGLLAAALPKDRVFTTPGAHDWPEWRRLWSAVLDKLPLPTCGG